MKTYTPKELQEMTLGQAQNELSNALYNAAGLIELLEYSGPDNKKRFVGNGHHMRQLVAKMGSDLLAERWRTESIYE